MVYWAAFHSWAFYLPDLVFSVLQLTEPRNRIDRSYFDYCEPETELGTDFSVSVTSVSVPIILVWFLALSYFCLG